MSRTRNIRARWAPLLKIATTSGADIFGDWMFYNSIANPSEGTDQKIIDTYKLPVLIFFIISCVMGGFTLFSILCKGCCPGPTQSKPGEKEGIFSGLVKYVNQILLLEILVEDFPQFILSSLVAYERGEINVSEVVNITTTAYNFVFNILDILTPEDESTDEERKALGGEQGENVFEA